MSSSKVRVAVRLKPEARTLRRCALAEGSNEVIVGAKRFTYDHVYNEETSQIDIYNECVHDLVEGCFKGYNGTLFAYGQTGSGKTFSTIGLPHDTEDEGIIPRALRHIFTYLDASSNEDEGGNKTIKLASVHVSFLEIYNEECKDLLHPEIQSREIMIREDKDGRIFFTGAREEIVSSVDGALSFLEMGNLQRTTAGTYMNATSSRSHAIFTVNLEFFQYGGESTHDGNTDTAYGNDGDGVYIQSKLHLVDLAGSERAKKTGAKGTRLKESVGINQGLLALGKVIRALTVNANKEEKDRRESGSRVEGDEYTLTKGVHVPYRESKLTRFLKDGLGGNSRTVMLACISPADSNTHETLSTLQYATRAKAVQNRIQANIRTAPLALPTAPSDGLDIASEGGDLLSKMAENGGERIESALVDALRLQLAKLQEEMLVMRQRDAANNGNSGSVTGWSGTGVTVQGGYGVITAEEDSVALRNSIDSLYDSINKGHIIPGQREGGNASGSIAVKGTSDGKEGPVVDNEDVLLLGNVIPRLKNMYSGLRASLGHLAGQREAGLALDDEEYANGAFWPLIASSRESVHSLSYILECATQASHENVSLIETYRKALANGRNTVSIEDELKEEISRLKMQLEGCYVDLAKDEEVFAEKIKDLKKCRKIIRELEAINEKLDDENQGLKQTLQKMGMESSPSIASQPRHSPHEARAKEGGEGKDDGTILEAPSTPVRFDHYVEELSMHDTPIREEDINDISLAVDSAEPHISNLMDDLETIQIEKEKLQKEKISMERKVQNIIEEANAQRHHHSSEQENLTKRLKELEVGIRLKQQCISELVRNEKTAEGAAEKHRALAQDLSVKASSLEEELDNLRRSHNRGKSEAREERERRVVVEKELNEVKKKAKSYQHKAEQAKRSEEKEKIYLDELQALRVEYSKLSDQVDSNESKHRKDLDLLTSQVSNYKKTQAESAEIIKLLEKKNSDLKTRLEKNARLLKGREGNVTTPTSVAAMSYKSANSQKSGREEGKDDDHAIGSSKSTANHNEKDTITSASSLFTYLQRRVDDYTHARAAKEEIQKVSAKCEEILSDQKELLGEYNTLASEQQKGTHYYEKKAKDLHKKLAHYKKQLSSVSFGSSNYREIEQCITTLESSLQEVDHKLRTGVLSNEKLSRLHDLAEEMETLNAELDLNKVRLEEESRKLAKVSTDNDGAVENKGRRSKAKANTNEADALLMELLGKKATVELGLDKPIVKVFANLASSLIDSRVKSNIHSATILDLQCQLDDKTSECEEMGESLHKIRKEYHRKIAAIKKEGEDKAQFLLEQLRATEARAVETSNILRHSQDKDSLNGYNPGYTSTYQQGAMGEMKGAVGGYQQQQQNRQQYQQQQQQRAVSAPQRSQGAMGGQSGGGSGPIRTNIGMTNLMSRDSMSLYDDFADDDPRGGSGIWVEPVVSSPLRQHNESTEGGYSTRHNRHSQEGAAGGTSLGGGTGMSHDSLYEELQNEKERRAVLERRSQELQRENRMLRRSHESE